MGVCASAGPEHNQAQHFVLSDLFLQLLILLLLQGSSVSLNRRVSDEISRFRQATNDGHLFALEEVVEEAVVEQEEEEEEEWVCWW